MNDDSDDGPIDLATRRASRQRVDDRDAAGKGLEAFADSLHAAQHRPAEFLAAWKVGVERIGADRFIVTAPSVAAATDRSELVPNLAVIEHALPSMSSGERHFLIAMCQFYCDSDIAAICRDADIAPPSLADLALLDDELRAVLVRLLEAYTGW